MTDREDRPESSRVPSPTRPSLPVRIALRLLLGEADRAAVLSDLRELWELRAGREGEAAARRWYSRQLRRYPLHVVRERLRRALHRSAERGGSNEPAPGGGLMEGIGNDVRYAGRGWVRSPVLALVILSTVGLGLGASTAMFAVVRTVLLEPLPYTASGRLVRIYHAIQQNRWNLSVADYQAIEAQQTRFEQVAAYTSRQSTFTTNDGSERVAVREVTAGFLDLLGVHAERGRTFERSEGESGAARTAVVSWGFWQRALGATDAAVGRTIRLDGDDYTVIGVLPRRSGPLLERFDIFPALQMATPTRRGPFFLTLIGRLRSEVEPAAAEAELQAINRRVFTTWQSASEEPTSTYGLMPLDEFVVGRFRTPLVVLLAAVALVLLVASTNAAGLLTARATRRQTELAARAALGASRPRLIRLLVTESILLAIGGALVGLGLAAAAVRMVRAAGPNLLPRAAEITLSGPVLAFAGLLAAASVVVFGVIPALQVISAGTPGDALRTGGRTTTGASAAQRMRRLLVASQFAITVPLLAGAALLLNSFVNLQQVDTGFDGNNVLTLGVGRLPDTAGDPDFWHRLVERVEAVPGARGVGLASDRPPCCAGNINNFDPIDRPTPPGQSEPLAVWLVTSPGYFDVLGIPLIAGRTFDERDQPDPATFAAIVDRNWVDRVYPGEDPIGRRFYEGGCKSADCAVGVVVGVVENVRYLGLDDSQAGAAMGTVYVPVSQWGASTAFLFVRSAGDPLPLLAPVRDIVHELDPVATISDMATADELVENALATPRNLMSFVAAFALIALALATIGIYGVMSFFVHEHRRDIGIRLALGGRPASVKRLIILRGMRPVLTGIATGLAGAILLTRFMTRLLFGVTPRDPATLAFVIITMLVASAAACWLPARAASRLDPMRTLRVD